MTDRRRPRAAAPLAAALLLGCPPAAPIYAQTAGQTAPPPATRAAAPPAAQTAPRARDLGVPFDGSPGRFNALTDVAGVAVGHTTLIEGSGRLVVGEGPVRTGVTAILPRGTDDPAPVFAGWFSLNGNGEMTGTTWIEESGLLHGPVLITNTHSVGVVRDATIAWLRDNRPGFLWALPVVAETWDGVLNDINGFHVRPGHVFGALADARGGRVAEGAVGSGTGMRCHGFKGGIGTSSRVLAADAGGYTVGVLVQCNYGRRSELRIAGVPVGRELDGPATCVASESRPSRAYLRGLPPCEADETDGAGETDDAGATAATGDAGPTRGREDLEMGSIIIVLATDAPLLPHQLKRLVKRAALGLGREGSFASNGSGDIFVAFSTANPGVGETSGTVELTMLPNQRLDPLFLAAVRATEEAITNALIAAETMTGADDVRVHALPHDALRDVLARYNRLEDSDGQ